MDGMGNLTFLDPGTLCSTPVKVQPLLTPMSVAWFNSRPTPNVGQLQPRSADMTEQVVDTADYNTDYGEDLLQRRNPPIVDTSRLEDPGQPEPGSTPSSTTVRFSEILPMPLARIAKCGPTENGLNSTTTVHQMWIWPVGNCKQLPAPDPAPIQHAPAGHHHGQGRSCGAHRVERTSSFYLKHTSDSIGLSTPPATVDTIAWSDNIEGESLVAPNSTHAGVGAGTSATGNWILSAWATPGEVNPVWPPIPVQRTLPSPKSCVLQRRFHRPTEDWVEVHNRHDTAEHQPLVRAHR